MREERAVFTDCRGRWQQLRRPGRWLRQVKAQPLMGLDPDHSPVGPPAAEIVAQDVTIDQLDPAKNDPVCNMQDFFQLLLGYGVEIARHFYHLLSNWIIQQLFCAVNG